MEDLFRSYWWLIFPLAWFIGSGWQSWLNYRTRRDALRLVQTYAERGQEPPAAVMEAIKRRDDLDEAILNESQQSHRPSQINWGWYQFALFGALAAGFTYMSRGGILRDEGLAEALLIVAVVMGALALASLVYALIWKGPKG